MLAEINSTAAEGVAAQASSPISGGWTRVRRRGGAGGSSSSLSEPRMGCHAQLLPAILRSSHDHRFEAGVEAFEPRFEPLKSPVLRRFQTFELRLGAAQTAGCCRSWHAVPAGGGARGHHTSGTATVGIGTTRPSHTPCVRAASSRRRDCHSDAPPLPLVDVSTGMDRERQQNDSLANGDLRRGEERVPGA